LIALGIGEMSLKDTGAARDALAPLLADPSRAVRIAATLALLRLKDGRAIPAATALFKSKEPPRDGDRDNLIRALGEFGSEAAVGVLNGMSFGDYDVKKQLLRLAHSSTAYAAWDAYLAEPIKLTSPDDPYLSGNRDALSLLEPLADREIYAAIRCVRLPYPTGTQRK
jgi:HEAT repeat protein